MVKLLHTADLHLGLEYGQFDEDHQRKLSRARLAVVEPILALAEQYDVNAVLWAGDIFDTPEPPEDWWRGFAHALTARPGWNRPVVLLPGNHDALVRGSVFHPDHPFRQLLPSWVHVVDCDGFTLDLAPDAVLLAAPCRSRAGADDLALSLPARGEGDRRIRIGLVHGSTFDLPDHQTNFPIASDAPQQRGLDYLAVGDTHAYRCLSTDGIAPIVYPGTPEPTRFGESET
ncbi:MAG: metallophosphoesterase, partial [Vicinamibacteraceae bacterium]